ncbi:MAG TPA: hypothetical protein EYQ42_05160 [Thiotrichaceae bacterium]|jgi:beta-hydroxylase|nr:hypothetical protein [Thiotrichaceae bacterium]HIM08668.1 hypothetical protein [Gammaproteobacteria bacterium]
MFIFDNTHYHDVWNETDEDRVILLIHFERPLRKSGKAVANSFIWIIRRSPFIQTTLTRIKEWENLITDGHSEIKDRASG